MRTRLLCSWWDEGGLGLHFSLSNIPLNMLSDSINFSFSPSSFDSLLLFFIISFLFSEIMVFLSLFDIDRMLFWPCRVEICNSSLFIMDFIRSNSASSYVRWIFSFSKLICSSMRSFFNFSVYILFSFWSFSNDLFLVDSSSCNNDISFQ